MYPAPYVWTEQYHAAIFEIDSQKHFVEAALAEEAIQRRMSELIPSSANNEELIAIARALLVLKQLRDIEVGDRARRRLLSDNLG